MAGLPSPRMPRVAEITSMEQLLPSLRLILKRKPANMVEGMELKARERVLIVSDRTINPILTEAFITAIREMGATVEGILLEGYHDLTDPLDLVDNMFGHNWFPAWVWEAAREVDVVLALAFVKVAHTPNFPIREMGKPRYMGWELPPDLLLSDFVTYPVEVRDAIAEKTWKLLEGTAKIEITDLEGTELTFNLTQEDWRRVLEGGGERSRPGHLSIPRPQREVSGVLASSSITFGGPVPRTRFIIEGKQITCIEGGGSFGDRMRGSFEKYRDVPFPGQPGPGVNWLSTFGLCTHPKARPSPVYPRVTGSARVHAYCIGHRRSGVIHTAIGSTQLSPTHNLCRHFNLLFPTIRADGRMVVDQGHLVALDDPEVERFASRYGDPKKLLREDWIPAPGE